MSINDSIDRLRDVNYIGPGVWFATHMLAANTKTKKQKEHFIFMINILRENFVCPKCREHLNQFCILNPPENYLPGENLFHWSWQLHNSANRFKYEALLSKNPNIGIFKPFPYEEAKRLYFDKDTTKCSKSCSDTAIENENINEPKINIIKDAKFTSNYTYNKPNVFRIIG